MIEGLQAPVTRQAFEFYKSDVQAVLQKLGDEIDDLRARIAQLENHL